MTFMKICTCIHFVLCIVFAYVAGGGMYIHVYILTMCSLLDRIYLYILCECIL